MVIKALETVKVDEAIDAVLGNKAVLVEAVLANKAHRDHREQLCTCKKLLYNLLNPEDIIKS